MEDLHAGLSAAVHARGGRDSVLRNGLSKHSLPSTITFASLNRFHELVRETMPSATLFLGTVGSDLIMSVRVVSSNGKRKKKRAREDPVDLGESLARLRGLAPAREIERVKELLTRLYEELKGSQEEPAIQSTSIEFTKFQAVDPSPRAVIAVRVHAGLPLPLHRLKASLGPSWEDGAVTTLDSIQTMTCSLPPLSAEGKVALEAGSVSWSFLTSITPLPPP